MTRKRSIRPGFEQRLLTNLRACAVEQRRVAVGFSGGPDSLALAAATAAVAPALELEILLVHIDHGLRAESIHDMERCRQLALDLGLPIECVALPPGLSRRAEGLGIEEQGRRERYAAIARVASHWGAETILTGHQANDQAETVLLHLFRGAGLQGLGGMRLQESREIPWWDVSGQHPKTFHIVRPLLHEARQTIEQYLEEMGLHPVQDASNRSVAFDRNFVRHQVLPLIGERWPGIVETLGRSAQAIQIDAILLEKLTIDAESRVLRGDRALCTDELLELDIALAFRVLHRWLDRAGVTDVGFDVVARVYELASSGNRTAAVQAGSGVVIVVDDNSLTTLESLLQAASQAMPLDAEAGGAHWSIDWGDRLSKEDWSMTVPRGQALSVRSIRRGDRWFGTSRSVFEDLRAAGIHPQVRKHVLAITAGSGVLLIPAIYPTIRSNVNETERNKVGIRWWKQG